MEHLSTLQDYRGMSILRSKVDDLNECSENIHGCSKNGYCTNIMGTYRCQCGFGYQQSLTATHPPGTYCVARCTQRSCKNGGSCSAAPDEVSEVTCECQKGYAGESCEDKTGINNLSRETIVVIAVVASIAALLGVVLSVFACYTLFRRRVTDDSSEASSISGFKPKSLSAHEYDRMTDLGSVSRANHSFVSTIDEEPESTSIKSNNVFNSGLMGSRRSIPSEHGDPTPALSPVNRTDRHAASDISQPDYY
ncbi:transmembrane matrix receptor MUP-4-like [Watersipora subatra]|uniref:transmembrane matrix receptor MUP-4-like n=1 Tax=Watersipora subatra TaxID=2589382 RepID=UPI00355BC552